MSQEKGMLLRFTLEVSVEKREDCFAAVTKPFSITAYGDTAEEAERRAFQAVDMLLAHHYKTPKQMSTYLTHRNVKHVLTAQAVRGKPPTLVRRCSQEMEMEPVGA